MVDGKVVTVGFNHVAVDFNHETILVAAEAEAIAEVIKLTVGISPTSKPMARARPNLLAIVVG